MVKNEMFDDTKWKYVRTNTSITSSFFSWSQNLGGALPTRFSLRYVGLGKAPKSSFDELGKSIYLDSKQSEFIFETHRKRLETYKSLGTFLAYLFTIIFFVIVFITLVYLLFTISSKFNYDMSLAMSIFMYLFIIPITILSTRISIMLVARHFADTLSIVSGINLLIILNQEKSLSDPEARRKIISAIRTLRRAIILLPQTFINKIASDEVELYKLFYSMEVFVRDRERDAIASTDKTLSSLRKDFAKFVSILISGQYGDIKWKKITNTKIVSSPSRPSRFIDNLVRVLATVTPFILIFSIFLLPDYYANIGLNANWIMLTSLIWVLLILDAYLKLGIIERATGILKTMKDLN